MTISRHGQRWTWTPDEVERAWALLRRWCDGTAIHMEDITRAAARITGRRRTGRALRAALLAAGLIAQVTSRGRHADYRLLDLSAPTAVQDVLKDDDDDRDDDDHNQVDPDGGPEGPGMDS